MCTMRRSCGDIGCSFFSNSGTEANELAVQVARMYTGNFEVVALRHGYSGRSQLAQSLTGQNTWRKSLPVAQPGIAHALNPYCYRCPLGKTYPSCEVACAKDVEAVIQTTTSGQIAAFLAEPIQGLGGFITPPPEYFKIVFKIVKDYGGLYIDDEVQTGWGRTGTDFETGLWAFETVKPGAVEGRRGHRPMAPHVNLWIATRGINLGLATRMYFGDEEAANAADPVLSIIEQPERRKTLIARREQRDGRTAYVFDIRLQGEGETVFFDV